MLLHGKNYIINGQLLKLSVNNIGGNNQWEIFI